MAKATGKNANSLFQFGLPAVKDLINEKTWPMFVKDFIEMTKAAGKNAYDLFRGGLPAVRTLINEKTWPEIKNIFVYLVKQTPTLLENLNLVHAYVKKCLEAGQMLDKHDFIKSHLKDQLGFVPEGDFEGLLKFATIEFNDKILSELKDIFSKGVKKNFSLGKIYKQDVVSGVASFEDPVLLVECLVSVLLTQSVFAGKHIKEKVIQKQTERYQRFFETYAKAMDWFDTKKIIMARDYIKKSNLNAEITIINTGDHDVDDAALYITSPELLIESRDTFEIDSDPNQDDNIKVFNKRFTIPSFKQSGSYTIWFISYYDITKESMRLSRTILVQDCVPTAQTDTTDTITDITDTIIDTITTDTTTDTTDTIDDSFPTYDEISDESTGTYVKRTYTNTGIQSASSTLQRYEIIKGMKNSKNGLIAALIGVNLVFVGGALFFGLNAYKASKAREAAAKAGKKAAETVIVEEFDV